VRLNSSANGEKTPVTRELGSIIENFLVAFCRVSRRISPISGQISVLAKRERERTFLHCLVHGQQQPDGMFNKDHNQQQQQPQPQKKKYPAPIRTLVVSAHKGDVLSLSLRRLFHQRHWRATKQQWSRIEALHFQWETPQGILGYNDVNFL